MPVPQRVNFLVEQASCLLSENGATSQLQLTSCRILNKPFMGGFWGPTPTPHKKIDSLWNRSESLLSENGAICETIALSDSKCDRALHPAPSGQHQIEFSKQI
ncbi:MULTISPECIES: hypothetical protein [unclassified Microcoleus]|uniref:hypothetical protein n=1 Tax=unclassified Microcoleus TaxID=2642155 RepID=UPI002FD620E9